jgi:hypothetical protein
VFALNLILYAGLNPFEAYSYLISGELDGYAFDCTELQRRTIETLKTGETSGLIVYLFVWIFAYSVYMCVYVVAQSMHRKIRFQAQFIYCVVYLTGWFDNYEMCV